MKDLRSKVLVTAFFVLCYISDSQSIFPQEEQIKFRQMLKGTGMEIFRSIKRTSDGHIWFTGLGLSRFDGYELFTYSPDGADSSSLPDGFPQVVTEGMAGQLWIGVGYGYSILDPATEKFSRMIRTKGFVRDICMDSLGQMWIATNVGFLVVDAETKKTVINNENTQKPVLTASICITKKGRAWLATSNGLISADPHGGVDSVYHYSAVGQKEVLYSIVEDYDGILWMKTSSGKLLSYEPDKKYWSDFELYDSVSAKRFRWDIQICALDSHRLLIGTTRGLIIFDKRSKRSYTLETGIALLDKGPISDIYRDELSKIWVTTRSRDGLYCSYSTINPFHVKSQLNDRSTSTLFRLLEDRNGDIWCGSEGNGLYRFDSTLNLKNHYMTFPDYPTNLIPSIGSFFEDEKGLWIGTYKGLSFFDYETESFSKITLGKRRWDENALINICEYDSGNLLISILSRDLILYDKNSKSVHVIRKSGDSLGTGNVFSAVCDQYAIWLATDRGLFEIDRNTGYSRYYSKNEGLLRNQIWEMMLESDSLLWIGTSKGLNLIRIKDKAISSFTVNDGMLSNAVCTVIKDRKGNYWFATEIGLTRYDPITGSFRNFGEKDGIPPIQFSIRSGILRKNGRLLFAMSDRLIEFDPDNIPTDTVRPKMAISKMDNIVKKETQYLFSIDTIKLDYNESQFTLYFAALNFELNEKNQYAYQLEGFDKGWIRSGNRNSAHYSNIPPGEYVFRVKGSNNEGVWNEEGASIRVIITPPWWKTWWAYSVYGVLFVGLLYGVRRYELNRQRLKHEAEIEHMEAKKLREMDQMKSRFFANISHEFRTPLTLIEGPARRILSEEGSPKENAHLIVRNSSRLLQLVNQLLDLSKIEAGQLKLRVEQTNLCDLVKGIGAAFETMARKKVIRYKIEVPQREEYGWVDGDAVEKCITNLLSNAMKFTPEGGSVTLAMESDAERMTVRVTDSGIGIEEFNMQKVFDRFYQVDDKGTRQFEGTGIGLALTKDLVELHQGTIGIESTPGVGSTFTMSIPVNKESYTPEQLFEPVTDKTAEPKARKEDIEALDVEDVRSGEDARYGNDEQDGQELPLILLIEDNEDMRKYIRMHLNGSYKIVEASDGVEGLGKALETVPDLIISDQMMPKMEGSVLVQKVKSDKRISHIPVILLTAKAEKKDKLEGLGVGADDYLVKPFDATELKARMDNLILQRRKLWDKFRTEWMTKPRETHAVSSDEKFLAQVMGIIEKNMSDPDFDISRLSEATALSRMQLHRKVKTMTGCSPGELLRNVRLEKASEMIRKNTGTITQIAFDVGFNNLSYFAKAFREKFGMNPSDF